MEADASNYIIKGILFQYNNKSILHFIIYYSKKILFAKCNYHIYNKELLAIIYYLETWKFEFEAITIFIKVFIDYKGLEYFMQA